MQLKKSGYSCLVILTCFLMCQLFILVSPAETSVSLNKEQWAEQLDEQDYEQVFRYWDFLSSNERNSLLSQLQQIDLNLLNQQKELLKQKHSSISATIEPFYDFDYTGQISDKEEGHRLIGEGKLGCLILAGGQGSRLGFSGPKGIYPVSIIKHKTLFQLFAERTLAAGKQAGQPLLLAIMTSPQNDEETRQFFIQNQFFGLQPDQVFFFCQKMLPLLDSQGRLFLDSPSQISVGPNGNGLCLHEFVHSGIWSEWKTRGIEYLHLILIDNPLADPFDAELLGFHFRRKVDVTLKCTEKENPEEKIGVIVKENHRCRVIEYSEMPSSEKSLVESDGRLKHRCGNLSMFCFSMDFVEETAKHQDMPLHLAWKAVKYLDETGLPQQAPTPNAWKFETFVFDVLKYTQRVAALLYPREECFAPLKNKSGENSLATVQVALQKSDRRVIEAITGMTSPDFPFELALDFYYPTSNLLAKWKGRQIASSYVEP